MAVEEEGIVWGRHRGRFSEKAGLQEVCRSCGLGSVNASNVHVCACGGGGV